ncbi:MAG: hypothetical protein ABSF70_08860 [Terracidiphilus sp.]
MRTEISTRLLRAISEQLAQPQADWPPQLAQLVADYLFPLAHDKEIEIEREVFTERKMAPPHPPFYIYFSTGNLAGN